MEPKLMWRETIVDGIFQPTMQESSTYFINCDCERNRTITSRRFGIFLFAFLNHDSRGLFPTKGEKEMSDGVQYLIRDNRRVGGTPNLRSQGISQVPLPSVMCCNFSIGLRQRLCLGGIRFPDEPRCGPLFGWWACVCLEEIIAEMLPFMFF